MTGYGRRASRARPDRATAPDRPGPADGPGESGSRTTRPRVDDGVAGRPRGVGGVIGPAGSRITVERAGGVSREGIAGISAQMAQTRALGAPPQPSVLTTSTTSPTP